VTPVSGDFLEVQQVAGFVDQAAAEAVAALQARAGDRDHLAGDLLDRGGRPISA
jgi:hypothetical protein